MSFDEKYYEKLGFSQKEVDKTKILFSVAKEITSKNIVLGGGTSLLLGYGLNRASTDLDIYTDKMINSYDIKNKVSKCFEELKIRLNTYSERGKDNRYKVLIFDYMFKNNRDVLKIECKFDKEKLMYASNVVKKNDIYVFNIKNICYFKTKALLGRNEGRDIFDIGFLIHHFPENFNNKSLLEVKEKLDTKGSDKIKKLFEDDEVIKRFNSGAIVDLLYKDIEKLTINMVKNDKSIDRGNTGKGVR